MSFTLDTKGQSTLQSTNPVTYGYTCGSGTKLLVVTINIGSTSPRAGGTPTYNSIAMRYGTARQSSGESAVEVWFLENPPTGSSYTISVPNTGLLDIVIDAISFKCTKSYAVLDSVASGTGSA